MEQRGVRALELHQMRALDVLGEVPAMLDRDQRELLAEMVSACSKPCADDDDAPATRAPTYSRMTLARPESRGPFPKW
jgi:hypothetical protein